MVVPSEVKWMVRESSSTFAAKLVGTPRVCWAKELTWQVEWSPVCMDEDAGVGVSYSRGKT